MYTLGKFDDDISLHTNTLHNKLIVCDFKVLIINILSFEKKCSHCYAHVFISEAVNDWLPIEFVMKEKWIKAKRAQYIQPFRM